MALEDPAAAAHAADHGRIFVLSPANCAGKRAQMVLHEHAAFDLAVRLRSAGGAPLGEVFSFMSGLYFRGKLAYARAFARAPAGTQGVLVITPRDGLRPADERVDARTLAAYARVAIAAHEPRYRTPLRRDAERLAVAAADSEIVLLGSIATDKYIETLGTVFGSRLRFPAEFVGRGDMSRGGLLLRCVDAGRELTYVPLEGTVRHGTRPVRLERRR